MRRIVIAATAFAALVGCTLPVAAATPSFAGSVGPSFTISMAKKPSRAGKITLVVSDRASFHNFHLRGPGNKEIAGLVKQKGKKDKPVKSIATSIPATGTTTFVLTLKAGAYRFVCDAHASMKGSFRVK